MLSEIAPEHRATYSVTTDSGLRADLFSADEVRGLGLDDDHELVRIVDWCETFLGKPNGTLGRSGNVCPFVPEALMRGSLKFAIVELRQRGVAAAPEIEEIIAACRDHFLSRERAGGKIDIFGAMVLVFPDITNEEAPMVIDPSQREMKPGFVQEGLMLGEFHAFSATPGLRNRYFRPLRSPIPLLAIRHMVESDVDFLMAPNDPAPTRVKSLRAYLRFLGPSLSAASRTKAREALLLAEAESEVAPDEPATERVRVFSTVRVASTDYSAKYLEGVSRIAAAIDPTGVDRIVRALCEVRDAGGRVFFLGVGGGASHAGHAVGDLRKIAGIESYSPSDNLAELTARINDEGWETAYAQWLRGSHLNKKDAVFVFSVGGGNVERKISVNLVRGLQLAQAVGAKTLGIVGRDGGVTAALADASILIPVPAPEMVTAMTESFQSVIWHAIVSHPDLRANEMKWESER